MEILSKILEDNAVLTILSALLTAFGAACVACANWVIRRLDHHDNRLIELEQNHVNQEEFNSAVSEIRRKLDDGFKATTERFDQLYRLLIEQASRNS